MPKKSIDYSKSIIYTISKNDLIYVGSTTDFIKRKSQHKISCNNQNTHGYNYKVYVMIRENGGWDSFEMKPYKEFPCENKIQLLIEEEKVRQSIANLNKIKAITTEEERKEQKNISQKEYYNRHKEQCKEYLKKYMDTHKNEKKEYDIQYRINNNDKIKEKNKITDICQCGKKYTLCNKSRHEQTNFHLKYLEIIVKK